MMWSLTLAVDAVRLSGIRLDEPTPGRETSRYCLEEEDANDASSSPIGLLTPLSPNTSSAGRPAGDSS